MLHAAVVKIMVMDGNIAQTFRMILDHEETVRVMNDDTLYEPDDSETEDIDEGYPTNLGRTSLVLFGHIAPNSYGEEMSVRVNIGYIQWRGGPLMSGTAHGRRMHIHLERYCRIGSYQMDMPPAHRKQLKKSSQHDRADRTKCQ